MVTINSRLGSQQLESTGTRTFRVDDMSDGGMASPEARLQAHYAQQQAQGQQQPQPAPLPPQPMGADEVMELRRQRMSEAQGINPEARQRLNLLLGIGRATKNVTIEAEAGTVTYSLRTLKGYEQKHVISLAEQADKIKSVEATFPVRDTTLAYALYAVDNIDPDLLLGATGLPIKERLAARLSFIEELDDHVLRYLFDQHQMMVKENLIRFQSPEDVKEVAEQIKKSSGGSGA